MNKFTFSPRSEQNLRDVHIDLVTITRRALALSHIDFMVIEGKRTAQRQQQLFASGQSQTLQSRHLTGHAVDCVPIINGTIPWQEWDKFQHIADCMKQAAKELNLTIEWGGDWQTLKDGPHFQLPRKSYPA